MGVYSDYWKRYRTIQWALAAVFLGGLPILAVLGAVGWLRSELVCGVAISAEFVASVVWAIRFQTLRCPRCGNCFSGDWGYNMSFLAGKCVHCGLPKFSDNGN